MSKRVNKSRPVSFRVAVERWSLLARRADAAGLSVGAFAARAVDEALSAVQEVAEGRDEAYTDSGRVATGGFIEHSLPPGDRTETTDSDQTGAENAPPPPTGNPQTDFHGEFTPPTPHPSTETPTESGITDREARFRHLMDGMTAPTTKDN